MNIFGVGRGAGARLAEAVPVHRTISPPEALCAQSLDRTRLTPPRRRRCRCRRSSRSPLGCADAVPILCSEFIEVTLYNHPPSPSPLPPSLPLTPPLLFPSFFFIPPLFGSLRPLSLSNIYAHAHCFTRFLRLTHMLASTKGGAWQYLRTLRTSIRLKGTRQSHRTLRRRVTALKERERPRAHTRACVQEGVSRGKGGCKVGVMRETQYERPLSHATLQKDTRGKFCLLQHDLSAKMR